MEVHLVADTNLFFECKALEQLPWGELGYHDVVLLVTKPVLDEIDKHKKANGRTRARALEIFNRIREMLATSSHEVEIQPSGPRVVMRRMSNAKPDQNLKDELDYTKNDEKLVGITSALHSGSEGYDVKLFTDDTGPAMIAADFDVPYLMVPAGWRRPSAETPEEKKIKDLEKDLALYRSQEPKIAIRPCQEADGKGHVRVTRRLAKPLTPQEIDGFINQLKSRHPLVEGFTLPNTEVSKDLMGRVTTVVYSPPAQEKVEEYRATIYPQWLDRCRVALGKLHEGRDEIEGPLIVNWPMTNQGTRPATQVRIEFEAKGALALRRIVEGDNEDEDNDEDEDGEIKPVEDRAPPSTTQLPIPPKPPAFGKNVTFSQPTPSVTKTPSMDLASIMAKGGLSDQHMSLARRAAAGLLGPTDHLSRQLKQMSAIGGAADFMKSGPFNQHGAIRSLHEPARSASYEFVTPRMPTFSPRFPEPKNPERFYYEWPLREDVNKGALTCELWRHHSRDEIFDFEVVFTGDGPAKGTVECTVHADNLTKPENARIIVSRVVEYLSMAEVAAAMVKDCG
ncbi:hypothetical protein HLH89_21345 [Rhizobium laguerreae]|uniref:PIN domain-containing protein n=1 Tax=Rhizobium laguerreae TaxID=1076926 RepID=UPI00147825FB|nr:PIN domain-containing protein [Rhizobium laguerreae]NNH83557.1 hypothetical protein [Rhizobium laguerreae]